MYINTAITDKRADTSANSVTILRSECPQSSKWWCIGDILKIRFPVSL